jgi:hypothetical protein
MYFYLLHCFSLITNLKAIIEALKYAISRVADRKKLALVRTSVQMDPPDRGRTDGLTVSKTVHITYCARSTASLH